MSLSLKPSLKEVAQRNPAVTPERVRQMQAVVKQLQDLGVLKPAKYGIQPALGGDRRGFSGVQGLKSMNRVGNGT